MSATARMVAVGLVIGIAVGVGIGAIAFSSSDNHASTTATTRTTAATTAGTKPISLPATLAGYKDLAGAIAASGAKGTRLQSQVNNQAHVRAATEAAYRTAFAGAASAYRAYSDRGLSQQLYVIAVRATAPGMTIGPVSDPAFLGLATPEREVKSAGDVSCQIEWLPPTVAGQTAPASSEHVVACQRSASGMTVFTGGSGFTGPSGLQAMAGFTNAAWTAASG
jgi:hypothetical protein